jgi:hypothetical protein
MARKLSKDTINILNSGLEGKAVWFKQNMSDAEQLLPTPGTRVIVHRPGALDGLRGTVLGRTIASGRLKVLAEFGKQGTLCVLKDGEFEVIEEGEGNE